MLMKKRIKTLEIDAIDVYNYQCIYHFTRNTNKLKQRNQKAWTMFEHFNFTRK